MPKVIDRDGWTGSETTRLEPHHTEQPFHDYGNDNSIETNGADIVSINLASSQVAKDNITETGHQSNNNNALQNHYHIIIIVLPDQRMIMRTD